jgi:hypothetical protein
MGDQLASLPTDASPLSPDERSVINRYFSGSAGKESIFSMTKLKGPLLATAIFVVLSLPPVNSMITKLAAGGKTDAAPNPNKTLAIRAIVFFLLYLLLSGMFKI